VSAKLEMLWLIHFIFADRQIVRLPLSARLSIKNTERLFANKQVAPCESGLLSKVAYDY